MARAINNTLTFPIVDRSGEVSRVTINTATATDLTDVPAEVTAFVTAYNTICDGVVTAYIANASKKLNNTLYSTDGQREQRWLCEFQDNTTLAKGTVELPAIKASIKPAQGVDFIQDLTVAPWAAFKTAFEALVKSNDGNAVTLLRVTLVGRNV